MTTYSATISATSLDAQLALINAAGGAVVALIIHPYITDADGAGPSLLIVWSVA